MGMNCNRCGRTAKPYVTAYEIAVKQGFRGTEAEWIATLQSVYLTRVNSVTGETWKCSDTYAKLIVLEEIREVHLVTLDGRTAFPQGNKDGKLVFRTASYESNGSTVYEQYTLTSADTGTWILVDVDEHDAGSISKTMLSTQVQNLLDGAVQKSAQAAKTDEQTQAVGIDANGKMWVSNITDYIPASVQPASTGMTCQVGLDANQQLWAEGYKVPVGGIPETDLASAVQTKLNRAGIWSIVFTVLNNVYSFYDADFSFTSVDDLIQQIENGRNVRIVILGSNDTYPAVHFQGSESLARVYFAGPTVLTGGSYSMTMDAFELAPSGQSISLTKVVSESL